MDQILPLNATAVEIAEAVRRVQARAKKGLCEDPEALGNQVRRQLDAAVKMAQAVQVPMEHLGLDLQAWGNIRSPYVSSDSTVVHVGSCVITVRRGSPWSSARNGALTMHLLPEDTLEARP
jgi:hypothetical protein